MSSTSSGSLPIPVSSITKLDGTNYPTWAVAACTYLTLNKLWPYIINHDSVKLTSTSTQADKDAFFFRFTLTESEPMSVQLDNLTKLKQDIAAGGLIIDDMYFAFVMLLALPDSYSNIIDAILTVVEASMLEPAAICQKIISEEAHCKSNPSAAIVITSVSRSKDKGKKKPSKCHYCKKDEHWENKCRKKQKDQGDQGGGGGRGNSSSTPAVNTATTPAVAAITGEAQVANVTSFWYDLGSKGYWLWDKHTRSIIVSTDVAFNKVVFPNCPAPSPPSSTPQPQPNQLKVLLLEPFSDKKFNPPEEQQVCVDAPGGSAPPEPPQPPPPTAPEPEPRPHTPPLEHHEQSPITPPCVAPPPPPERPQAT
ncbi:hypothetical protein JAAARDRAFT_200848 [Jaapia argillacea MUCL 33604]|uniref:Retroviral polymerase SH3-like domain-containing protein n=1 Tax=Jaapia argillacea MUCL 33604 TaxID=933084 RepID=A0A067PEN1_9AGAM|nr:hypothetical protein JAAARDRAFT_200848 [Jaapia argillacea MUCL 33604]